MQTRQQVSAPRRKRRGFPLLGLDDETVQAWYKSATQKISDFAMATVLMIKRVFRLTLQAAQGFINSTFP